MKCILLANHKFFFQINDGDVIQVIDDEEKVKKIQKNHGGFSDAMKEVRHSYLNYNHYQYDLDHGVITLVIYIHV